MTKQPPRYRPGAAREESADNIQSRGSIKLFKALLRKRVDATIRGRWVFEPPKSVCSVVQQFTRSEQKRKRTHTRTRLMSSSPHKDYKAARTEDGISLWDPLSTLLCRCKISFASSYICKTCCKPQSQRAMPEWVSCLLCPCEWSTTIRMFNCLSPRRIGLPQWRQRRRVRDKDLHTGFCFLHMTVWRLWEPQPGLLLNFVLRCVCESSGVSTNASCAFWETKFIRAYQCTQLHCRKKSFLSHNNLKAVPICKGCTTFYNGANKMSPPFPG